jgi:hypothetical protein
MSITAPDVVAELMLGRQFKMLLSIIERRRQERARRHQSIVEGHVIATVPAINLIKQRHIDIVPSCQEISPRG